MVRRGFSLVEVIVAMTLLSIASLAVAASSIVSVQTFTRAELQEHALREAEAIVDSLLATRVVIPNRRTTPHLTLSWTASDSTGVVIVTAEVSGKPPFHLRGVR